MVMTRRSAIAGALAAPFALATADAAATPFAAVSSAARAESDPWVRLCAERRMLHELAESSVVGGDIPDEIGDACFSRVAEIDAEIAASQPTSARGLRVALAEYRRELGGCSYCDGDVMRSLLGAALAFTEEALS